MFKKMRLKYHGYERYGKIIKVEDVPVRFNIHALCIKRLTVEYCVNNQVYEVIQEFNLVMPTHMKKMVVGNSIRIRVNDDDPTDAYINEFDYPEYDLYQR
ncbi:hypothetical protein [Amedibacillus sp. YH-ame6]